MRPLAGFTRTLTVGAVLVAVGVLGACGDSDGDSGDDSGGSSDVGDAPKDASEEDFCDAFNAAIESVAEVEGNVISEDQFEAYQDAVAELGEVGTPDGVTDEQREGFELYVEVLDDLDYDDVKDLGPDDGFPGVDEEEEAKTLAFFTYASQTCIEDVPTEIPTQ
jgi:hypothetical protein